jgi:hypothetical protein
MNILIGLVSGLVFFLCLISTYLMGLKHGRLLDKKVIPNINPVSSLKKYIEQKKGQAEVDNVKDGWEGINNYNPYDIKDGE